MTLKPEPQITCYRFNGKAGEEPPKSCYAHKWMERLNEGDRLTRDEKNYLTERVNRNCFSQHGIPAVGWMYDFSPVLRRYLIRQYGSWYEMWAIDKTALRHTVCGRIDEIMEIGRA